MLRLYKPIEHDIFKLQVMLEHLVCSVWCEACNDPCEEKLSADFLPIYTKYKWLKKEVDNIYKECKVLKPDERQAIKDAFNTNNKIEDLCNGSKPVYLKDLPAQVEFFFKPLLVDFYETLLEKGQVPGTKKDYYEKLIKENEFQYCPSCGLIDFEQEESIRRESFDHYLPKSEYPFASVNFNNLVPLCYKCNSDRKKAKDPIEKERKAFYPFAKDSHSIEIEILLSKGLDMENINTGDIKINFKGDVDKIETWDWLFDITDRYTSIVKGTSKTFLRKIKRRHKKNLETNPDLKISNTIDSLIMDYEYDKFEDKKFLKIPVMKNLLSHTNMLLTLDKES